MSFRQHLVVSTVILAFVLVLSSTNFTPVSANVVDSIELSYDLGSQTLAVNVSHETVNLNADSIVLIEIWNNEVSVINRSYTTQTDLWGLYDTFNISASVGDNLTVTATCKKGNSLTAWLVISSTTTTSSTSTTTTTSSTSTTTTTTTGTTDNPDNPGTTANLGPVIAVGVGLTIFFILFFAWLKPEYVPDAIKQLGSRIKSGLSRLWVAIGNSLQHIKARISSK